MKFFQVRSVEETVQLIKENVQPLTMKWNQPLLDSVHFVLAEDLYAKEHVPSFRRSSVDGYAVKASDTFGASESMPGFLTLTGEVKMGEAATLPVKSGEAVYVPTGGMVPDGSDSVVMIEHCEEIAGLLNVYRQVAPGENVISIGEDVKEDSLLLSQGTLLRAQELGVLASQGITEVPVRKKPIVGYLSSGDEIVPVEASALNLGEVRDMNAITIGALVHEWGCGFRYGGIVEDDKEALQRRTTELLEQVDFLVLSGGSSVGTKDHSVDVIGSLGSPGVYVHGVAVKPGKPTILANASGKPVLGLPGHPASAMIIFQLFGRLVLERLQGLTHRIPASVPALMAKNIPSAPGRTDYVRVKLQETPEGYAAEPIFGKSGLISTLVKSDGIVEVPARSEGILKGEQVLVQLFT